MGPSAFWSQVGTVNNPSSLEKYTAMEAKSSGCGAAASRSHVHSTPFFSRHGWPHRQAEGLAKQLQVIDSSIQVRCLGCFRSEFPAVSKNISPDLPVDFLFWMAYDGVFVLKQTLSKHVKHQMPAQDWDRQPEVDSAHLMSPQTHIAAAKWMIQEFIDDLWIINL